MPVPPALALCLTPRLPLSPTIPEHGGSPPWPFLGVGFYPGPSPSLRASMQGEGFWLQDGAPVGGGRLQHSPRAPRPPWACGGPSGKQACGQDFWAQRKVVVNVEAQVRGAGSRVGICACSPPSSACGLGNADWRCAGPVGPGSSQSRAEPCQGPAPKGQGGGGSSPVGSHLLLPQMP